ncbi:MAG: hypothetical protein ASARMPREDX12_007933 [Alectoria sarmentosa]|nr:MAG: hypothetical protein ASARMPRED_000195 [Alectoria sarmentosa]CAD6593999.1 MAG: hypothetical protein ASARMPREDX12_007933 [Alectoria sarmentosa]
MTTEQILYLSRADSDGEHVLVNVSPGGPSALDLTLLATEGESPYIATLRQSRISKLRDKRNQLSDDQWENVLHSTLLRRRVQGPDAGILENLEVLAALAGEQLSIIFRNNISGITQKLGEVVFKKDESQEVDITRWAGMAVERSIGLEREVRNLTSKYDEQSKEMERLKNQLEDLVKAKIEHENSLLQSFTGLLNTKKLKIRDQQRLLASAKVDPKQAAKLRNARSTSKPRAATASRAGKRKAKSGHGASESSEESGFEGKAPIQKPESDLSEEMNTPEHSDQDVTADETGDDLDSTPQSAKLPDRSKAADGAEEAIGEEMQLDAPPPTRDLPFGEGRRREQTNRAVTEDKSAFIQEPCNEDEETDDDEL